MMKIELLSFRGCPNGGATQKLLQVALTDLGIREEVLLVDVENEQAAHRLNFLGSPSIHVNGQDIEPARRGDPPAFSCRIYRDQEGRLTGVPPRQLVEAALRFSP